MLYFLYADRPIVSPTSVLNWISVVCSMNDDSYRWSHNTVVHFCGLQDVQLCMLTALWFLPQVFTFYSFCCSRILSQYPRNSFQEVLPSTDICHSTAFYHLCQSNNHQHSVKDADDALVSWCTSQASYTLGQGLYSTTPMVSHSHLAESEPFYSPSLAYSFVTQSSVVHENGARQRGWLFPQSRFVNSTHTELLLSRPQSHIYSLLLYAQSHDWKRGSRVGEASHPGPISSPPTKKLITVSLVNPTTIYQKEDDLLSLNSDVLCLAETAATRTVQLAFNQAVRTTKYRTFWSAPVPDKITKTDPHLGTTLRGDNLGTAILTKLPSRDTRLVFPPAVWETCRVNSTTVSTGLLDIVIISTYFHTGKSAEARIVNNQLMHDLWSYILSIDLPFVIAGDFNTDIHKLDAYSNFRNMGCQEMFQFHRQAFGFDLPPTCKGATRYDSMIFHPSLVKYIHRIDIGPEHQFADHCAVHVQFNVPPDPVDARSWFVPKSWTLFPLDPDTFASQYRQVRCSTGDQYFTDPADCLAQWSLRVEKAVHKTLGLQKAADPLQHEQGFLPQTFRGRCAQPKLIRHGHARAPKRDITGQYEPPVEVTSLKSRQKIRQVRRLRSLERLFKKYDLVTRHTPPTDNTSPVSELRHLWQVIYSANGYGRSWAHWLLQFESVTVVPQDLPNYDQIYCFRQITQYDADLYCQHEAKLRRQSRQHALNLDIQYKSSSQFYKRLKDHEAKVLPGFPVRITAQATLCRSIKGQVSLIIHQPMTFRLYAAATFGDARIRIMEQHDSRIICHILHGQIPTHGDLVQEVFAFEVTQMAAPFEQYWSQFWNRDSPHEECSDHPWEQTIQSLCSRIPPSTPLQVLWDSPRLLQQTIQRLKPFKAVGIDGWRAEELQSLPSEAVEDLADILAIIWPQGLPAHHLIARVVLLAKRQPPTAITDGRPITILGYLSRLTSKLVADQLLNQWASTWPSAISGGLPFRGVQDITFMQQFQIEAAKTRSLPWRGFTLDLIKAFNLLPRRVIYHLLVQHGAPPQSINFWFQNLRNMTRRLQVRQAIGPAIHMTTGVPEGDSMSVCAMLVVSSTFYWTLQTPTVFPYAYADNWSYLTTNQRDNILTFQKIKHLVEALRMQIDFTKSWAWGATADARHDWQTFLLHEFPDDNPVKILNSTKDLGCMTHYTHHITLGHLKTKMASAVQRCRRIRWFQLDITHKARLIQTAIWPHAFYGAETQIVGDKHFRTLRREATKALIGPEAQISSWLAVHLFSPQLQDPLLYVITNALAFLRRMFHVNPDLANQFLQAVLHHDGPAVGPAGALARYLTHVGWSLDSDGRIALDGCLSVSIRYDALKYIRQQLRLAWAYQINRNICHRKGVQEYPFDFVILSRVLRTLPIASVRLIAYNLTGGYQVGAVKALWSATTDAHCPYCDQIDTHTHQQLECPAFQEIRNQHPQAVTYLTHHPQKQWIPLPGTFPHMAELRQFLMARGQDTGHTHIGQEAGVLYFYTDGSADTPLHPETRRAAWSVIQFRPDSLTTPFLTIKIQHVRGPQSIARAELAAVTWIIQQATQHHWPHQIVITTDSQYVINTIHQITQPNSFPAWHHLANADLLQIIAQSWSPSKFVLRKVRSHQNIHDVPPGPARDDVMGNSWADYAAVQARKTDHEIVDSLFEQARIWHNDQFIQTKIILKYLAALNQAHATLKQGQSPQTSRATHHDPTADWGTLFRQRELYEITSEPICLTPTVHPAFITACVWGNQYADLVLRFCASLKWPNPHISPADEVGASGITWHELAIAFIVNTGLQFPTWIRKDGQARAQPVHWQDPAVLALPITRRSLREQAEAFRTIVIYLQGYATTPLVPKYSKTGSSSLAQVGWGRSYTGGFASRPEIPNSGAVQQTLVLYADNLHCKPPYHPDGLVPMRYAKAYFPTVPAQPLTFEQKFKYRRNLRKVWNKNGDLDSVVLPAPN